MFSQYGMISEKQSLKNVCSCFAIWLKKRIKRNIVYSLWPLLG